MQTLESIVFDSPARAAGFSVYSCNSVAVDFYVAASNLVTDSSLCVFSLGCLQHRDRIILYDHYGLQFFFFLTRTRLRLSLLGVLNGRCVTRLFRNDDIES